MRRIIVMGPPGGGKSTLARALGLRRGLPVHHLDQIYWRAGWTAAPAAEFAADVARLAAGERWVIDGNYTATIGPRLARADAIVYLDVPTRVALPRVIRRALAQRGAVRSDMPEGCPERIDWRFFWFALNWNRRNRRRSLDIVRRFAGRRVELASPIDVARFLDEAEGRLSPAC